MYVEEFEKLKNSVGKVISIVVSSTTTNCAVAVEFVDDGSLRSNIELVMFEIDIDLKIDSKPFGDDGNAMKNYELASALYSRHYRANDPYVAVTNSNIATVLDNRGDYNSALVMDEHALETMQLRLHERHPSNHLSESTRTSDYSHTTQQLDDYDEAEGDENEGRDVDVNNSSQEDNSLAEEEIDNHSTL
ncbi:unnamed protein product [Didymodactylos carnosus]|uniref:Uncharacterized protein n=1 Tax=Didymodactylos carnosus TaxID=1234261 RepID=A0A813ZUZ2_9BILA|nr:unnamed protein product [Didymodactylos carnosus]CAF3685655.1 unnamed protein product [Didymodactylos carnosus]